MLLKGTKTGDAQDISIRGNGWDILASEVFDADDKIVVRLETPGMNKDDFDLQILENCLVVRGEKQIENERTEGQYHIIECAYYGRFERAIPLLDEVEMNNARANYKNGVLRVELPKPTPQRHKTITIN